MTKLSKYVMIKNLMCIILLCCLVMPIVTATEESLAQPVKLNKCVSLPQSGNFSTCTLKSIQYPNGDMAVMNISMIKDGQFFYYNSFCNTSQIGGYIVNTECDGLSYPYSFEVTPSGFVNNPNFYYILFIASMGVMVLGFSIKNGWITVLGTFGLVSLGLYVLIYGINGMKDTVYTWGFGLILLAVGGYIGIKSGFEMIEDL